MFKFCERFVTFVLYSDDDAIAVLGPPAFIVHTPVPICGCASGGFTASKVVVSAQINCSTPASDKTVLFVIIIVLASSQSSFVTVHVNLFSFTPSPVTPEVICDGDVISPAPLPRDHTPVPITGSVLTNIELKFSHDSLSSSIVKSSGELLLTITLSETSQSFPATVL